MDPGTSGKKKNIKKSGPKKSKKYTPADFDEIITIDRSNPEELADHYRAIIKDARSELSLALKRRDRDTDPECEHRLDTFKVLIMGKTRYKISPD